MLGLFSEERLASALIDYRYDVWVHGSVVRASGLGAIASSPETRRRGLVRTLLAEHLRRLRNEGVVLSLLYPFKFAFYRRLGWGIGARLVEAKVPPADLAAFGRPVGRIRRLIYGEKGRVHPAEGETVESATDILERIYSTQAPAYNLAARRTPENWLSVFELTHGRRHVFGWEDAAGVAGGYVALRVPRDEDMQNLVIREIFALTPEAWRGLLHFLAGHEAQNKNLVFTLPLGHPLFDVLDNPKIAGSKLAPGPMARVVDVASLLEARGTDVSLEGSCRLGVRDTLAPWNDGVFEVTSEGGQVRVGRLTGDSAPDLEMDVDIFSSLAVGVRPLSDYLAFGLVTGCPGAGLDFAHALFPSRAAWHVEFY